MKAAIVLILIAAIGSVRAEPRKLLVRCPACKGERRLSLTPPNLGQHDGEIGVTPGKPFSNHRWDVKHARCPLCGGTGRQEVWVLKANPPKEQLIPYDVEKALALTKPRTGIDDVYAGDISTVTEFGADVTCISELRMKNATVAEVMEATSSDQG